MIFCSRYGSSRNILSKIPSFKIIFSLNISGSLNIREEGRVELKNRNNNTDIFSLSVAWLAQRERSNRYFDREKEFPRDFPRNRGWKTDGGDGSWPKKGRKKRRKEGKKYDDAIYSPGKSFVLEE